MRGFEVQGHAHKVVVPVIMQKSALHVQCIGKAYPFGHLAEGIGVADCAIKDQPGIFALGGNNVQFANLKAGWCVLENARWHASSEHAMQVVIWVLSARCKGLQELEAKRLSWADLQAGWVLALRVQRGMCDGRYLQLLSLGERMRFLGLAKVANHAVDEVMLPGEFQPVVDHVLQG